jgi:hypothetical protein
MIKYFDDIENGTVPQGLTSSSEFAFPINVANVAEELPGSTSSGNLDMGVTIVNIDLENLVLILEGDWVNRRLLQNDNQIVIRRDFLNKKFNYVKVQPDYSLLTPTTKIFLDSTTTLKQDLFDFVGTAGEPSANAKVILGDKMQNPLLPNTHSSEFAVTKSFEDIQAGLYNVDFTWKNAPDVTKNVLRWRPSPKIKRETLITFQVVESGAYDSAITANVSSDYGSGAVITPINSVTKVEILDAGSYGSTVSVIASSQYGSGASFSVSMTGSTAPYSIDEVTIINGGSGYIFPPTLIVQEVGGTSNTTSLKSYIGITAIDTISNGINYVSGPQVSISGTTGATGIGASVTASVQVYNTGQVDFVTVGASGSGYVTGESLTFSGGGGTGASAYVQAINGEIINIIMLDSGYGFTGTPTATINTVGGTGASITPVVTLLQDWNYVYPAPEIASYTVSDLLRNVEYEWQLFSATDDKNVQSFNSPLQRFKFF